MGFYNLRLLKTRDTVALWIEKLLIFEWPDNGMETGQVLSGDKIGFRQMAPLTAEYKNLTVTEVL